MKLNFYSVLEVSKDASFAAIDDSYRKLSLKHHPDIKNDNPVSIRKFIDISEAYGILSDPETRRYYDIKLSYFQKHKQSPSFYIFKRNRVAVNFDLSSALHVFMNFIRKNDNFNDLIIGKKAKEVPFQGSNIRTFIPLTLQEISSGCKKTIHISPEKKCRNCMGRGSKDKKNTLIPCNKCSGKGKGRIVGLAETAACTICLGTGKIPENPCPVCHGKGICPQETEIEVVFPKGISEGNFIILYSLGNAGIRGNNSGDLILFIEEELDEKYIRRGYDIETELTIPMTSAVLGETFEVEDIYGQKQSFRIKPGTQPEDFVKIEGKGLPAYKNDRVGDFYIHIHVEIPKMLSDEAHQYFSNFVKQIDSVNDNRVPRKIGKYYIIDFDPGEKETNYRSAFKKAETLLASTKNPIAFNLSKIDIIDSVTIGMMLKIHLKLNAHKSALTLIGLSDMIFETMKDCSLDMIFTIIDNESCLD